MVTIQSCNLANTKVFNLRFNFTCSQHQQFTKFELKILFTFKTLYFILDTRISIPSIIFLKPQKHVDCKFLKHILGVEYNFEHYQNIIPFQIYSSKIDQYCVCVCCSIFHMNKLNRFSIGILFNVFCFELIIITDDVTF